MSPTSEGPGQLAATLTLRARVLLCLLAVRAWLRPRLPGILWAVGAVALLFGAAYLLGGAQGEH